ncbi:MAG: valine--tRNA ligase [Bacteroidales bacterium]|nr:valine--tRNA ligase [Bacteroidales bacterium]
MEIPAKYNPANIEDKWYEYWLENKFFHSEPNEKEAYTIVIPPPNVTGVLHMGHMLNNTIQDILVRRARMKGKNACWVPGTDHASIATEAKVVKKLAGQGIKKSDLTREEFLKHAWDWTNEHGGIILKQLRKLGASCDWDRTAFTMDEERSSSVIKVFVDLYNKGLIYRGLRMVNWDPKAQTALSNEEVIYKDEKSKLYYLRYYVDEQPGCTDGEESGAVTLNPADPFDPAVKHQILHRDAEGRRYAVVATTRPETIMGDTAMCINPKDPKNTWLKGKKVIVPLVNRSIPVIEDRYVEIEFGTGCLKVTPAHDTNDYMLGKTHNLETIDIFNADATLSEAAGMYIGMDRMDVRKQIVKDLEAAGLMEKVEDYQNKVGYSERNSDTAVEPRLCMQWFLRMQHFADIALPPVMNDELKFYPSKYKTTYHNWLDNIQDWCISRQLWWGHRIPAYFLPDNAEGEEKFVVAETAEKALELAKVIPGYENITIGDLRQDDDALDTWFSSWLWPLSLFKGISNPGNEEINYYYPTSDLVTGPDIIFFWVARMIMAGYEYNGTMPFKNVYFTGIVRDKLGRKMSKSLGNSPDPLELIAKYGADAVRMGMMLSAPAGNDILFDEALCEQGRNFNNKIWNAFRLVSGWSVDENVQQPESAKVAVKWFYATLAKVSAEIEDLLSKYRLSEALMAIYKLFWDDFCAWYLEMVKPSYGAGIDPETYKATKGYFDSLLRILHPFMPFITEELWQNLELRKPGDTIMYQNVSAGEEYDATLLEQFENASQIVMNVRNIRQSKQVSPKNTLEIFAKAPYNNSMDAVIMKLANISKITSVEAFDADAQGANFMVKTSEFFVPLNEHINVEEEVAKMRAEIEYYEKFLKQVNGKLSNEKFVNNAPANVVAMERKKQSDATTKLENLHNRIASLLKK